MSELLLDAAGRRRSPATMPGFHAGRPPRNKNVAIPPTLPSLSCVPPATGRTVIGCAAGSSCSGAPAYASRKRWHSASQTLTRVAARCSCGAARVGDVARSAWTTGPGSSSVSGSSRASSCPSARCFASSTARRAAARGQAPPPAQRLRRTAALGGVRRRFAPHQLRHAHAVEMAHEGVPLIVIQRQLGHSNLGITSVHLQGIDNAEIIDTVHARRAPTVPVSTTFDA
jgi:hypothetical protein